MARPTPLNAAHRKLGGRLVDFAGWEMPVQYKGLIEEHTAVRTSVGLFDVSHMGEIEFVGPGALEAANHLLTNDLARIGDGQAVYSGLLTERGTFVDDVVAYRFSPERIFICVNASNTQKDWEWMREHSARVKPANRSDEYAQIAVQGPSAAALLRKLTATKVDELKSYHFTQGVVAGAEAIISRTGYTGEDGFELYLPPGKAESVWFALLEEGADHGVQPCGLGCRDSLRTEMKYALYGNDIDDEHTPLEAGLSWIVKLDKPDFVGKPALLAQKAAGLSRKLVGFELLGAGIPRPHYPIVLQGSRVGEVTSGTMSPTLKKPIGMGYVPLGQASEGCAFEVSIRGRAVGATVVKTPFYQRR